MNKEGFVVFTSGEAMLVYKSILLSNLLGAQAPVKSGENAIIFQSTKWSECHVRHRPPDAIASGAFFGPPLITRYEIFSNFSAPCSETVAHDLDLTERADRTNVVKMRLQFAILAIVSAIAAVKEGPPYMTSTQKKINKFLKQKGERVGQDITQFSD